MNQKTSKLTWLILILVLALTLGACVRSAPREEEQAPEAAPGIDENAPVIVIPTTPPVEADPGVAYPAPGEGEADAPAEGSTPAEGEAPAAESPPAETPAEGEGDAAEAPPAEAPAEGEGDAAPPTNAQGEQIHVVQAGENLYRIGLQCGFGYEELGAYNGIPFPYTIYEGQEIRIPPSE